MGSICMKPTKPEQRHQRQQRHAQSEHEQLESSDVKLSTNSPRMLSIINEEGVTSVTRSTSPATVQFADVPDNFPSNDDTPIANVDDGKDQVDSSMARDLIHIQRGQRYRSPPPPPPPVQLVDKETNDEDEFGITDLETDAVDDRPTGNSDSVEHQQDSDQVMETTEQEQEQEEEEEESSLPEAVSVTSCRLSDDSGVIDGGPQRDEEHTSIIADQVPPLDVTSGGDEPETVNSVVSVMSRSNSSVSDGSVLAAVSVDERPTIVAPPVVDTQNSRHTTTILCISAAVESEIVGTGGTDQRKNNAVTIRDKEEPTVQAKPRLGITQQRALLDGPDVSRFRIF